MMPKGRIRQLAAYSRPTALIPGLMG